MEVFEITRNKEDRKTYTWTTSQETFEAENEEKAFAKFFREYDNRLKYINDLHYQFTNPEVEARYRIWISDVSNYANNGGDMW
jgi:hypothetical protein